MIQIDGLTFSEIRKEFTLKKAELDRQRVRRAEHRANLSEEDQEDLDKHFLATFNEIIHSTSTDCELLAELLEKGAQTTFFKDYELSDGDNFAQALKDWLRAVSFTNEHSAIAKALDICLEAGDGFLTNKYYVGNGGALSIYLLFEYVSGKWVYISNSSSKTHADESFILHLYIKMSLLAGEHTKFWEEFYLGLQLLLRDIKGSGTKLQNRFARFALHCFVYEKPAFIKPYFTRELDYNTELVGMVRICFSADVFLDELLEHASSGNGIFGDVGSKKELNKVLAEKWPKVYGVFLSSSASRKKIAHLLKSSAWLRSQFISHPASLFKLVKEKEIMLPLLQKEREQLLQLRNEHGDNLLLALCKAQGKIENLVELYLKYGFDPHLENDKGESALSIAKKRKKEQLLLVLGS